MESSLAKVNLCSPDHISLLVHRTFNVSIPRHHIPIEEWEFEYGPAENDPEYGKTDSQGHEATTAEDGQEIDHSSGGKWVKRMTGEPLGGQDGVLQFTVIGLTVANEMLSLLGSIQPDPFSPRHTNQNGNTKSQKDNEDKSELEESEAEEGSDSEPESDEEEEEVESDMDTRHSLGKRKDVDETSKNVGRAKDKKR
ncbi:hypothetical protein JR316_0002258 [Psilocybe cubensis]|uniref:Uncharacterized protein n=2 Tax=Psilocybe cubensis TaxID=181762 RepID=A0ACB8HBG9_PSICU|nr:hypothetical protein JR316_0002258 [Psilocybe cubensis]KAH9485350.1 hypothetical protein JR316_0002258 [Psilocybe cubensis]